MRKLLATFAFAAACAAAAAQPVAPEPLTLTFNQNGPLGRALVLGVAGELDHPRYGVKSSKADNAWRVHVTAMDHVWADGVAANSVGYMLVLTRRELSDQGLQQDVYYWSTLGVCGSARIDACARNAATSLVTNLRELSGDLRPVGRY